MAIVTPHTYVPILYTKRGERTALRDLEANIASEILPLFVFHEVGWNFNNNKPKTTLDDHLSKILVDLMKKWEGVVAFVDAVELGDSPTADGRHPLVWLTDEMLKASREATPVTSVDRSYAYQQAVKQVLQRHTDLTIRLKAKHWGQATDASSRLFTLISSVGSSVAKTHLIFDMESSVGGAAGTLLDMVLARLVRPQEWASTVVAASSMPSSMPSGDGLHRIERPEWLEYQRLVASPLPRTPSFGDYCVQSPDAASGLDPRLISPSNNLRYLMDSYWYVPKGGLFKRGSAPLVSALRLLANDPGYISGYSACERWIDTLIVGPPGVSAGNPETWRRYGTVRHITRSVELIANLHASSKSPAPGPATP